MRTRIPRNNQDVVAKYLSSACAGEVLQVLGIPQTTIVRALPTELPRVVVSQSLTDIVLETATGEILHLEFQSTKEPDLYRFFAYDVALADKFRRPIRTYVLYTRRVSDPPATLPIGCATYQVRNIALADLDGEAALDIVAAHLASHLWNPTDRVRLAFAFHMRFSTISTNTAFRRILELTRQVEREEQNYLAALILGFSGRQLSSQQTAQMLEVLEMTELMRIVERKATKKGREEGREEGRKEGRQQTALSIAKALLQEGLSPEKIAEVTQLPIDQVRTIAKR